MSATVLQATRTSEGRDPARKLDGFLFFGLSALVIFGPLAFGAVEDWAIFTQEIAAAVLLGVWVAQSLLGQNSGFRPNQLYAPMALLALTASVQVVFRTSGYGYATLAAALQYGAYFISFFLANQLIGDAKLLIKLAKLLTTFGFLLATTSIVLGFAAPDKLFGIRNTLNTSGMYGPYVDHSHYAGLMEMLAPFPLVMTLRRSPGQQRLLWAVAAFFMAGSIFLSGSRGGMLAFSFELLLVLGIFFARNQTTSMKRATAMVLILFAGFVIWFGSSGLLQRLATFRHPEIANKVRLQIAHDSLQMFAARPVLGWGLGNFEIAYSQFRSFYTNDVVNAAHNDYLQFLAELGLVGFCAILWFLFRLYQSGIRGIRNPEPGPISAIRLAALVGVTGIALHSFTDFNLQVPANIALFFVLCAIVTSGSTRSELQPKPRSRLILVAALSCIYALLCVRGYVTERLTHSWNESRLRAAARLTPQDAEPWVRLGHLNYLVAQDPVTAAADLRTAVSLNPFDSRSWLELAGAYEFMGDRQRQRHAVEMAVKSDPTRPGVLMAAANSYLSAGDEQNGLHRLRIVAEHNRELMPDVLDLAWRATHDPASILREVAPNDPLVQIALLNLVIQSGKAEDVALVWRDLSKSDRSYDAHLIFPYVQYLLDHNQGAQAALVWQHLCQAHASLSAYQTSANLIVNPGFEDEMLNAGLDWRYWPVGNVSIVLDAAQVHGGRHSLALSFDGEIDDTGIFQSVPVKPNTGYTLTGFYKIEQMEGVGGVQFEVADAASNLALNKGVLLNQIEGWQSFEEDFSTGQTTELVKLRLIRVPRRDVLQGKIWIDDLALSQK